MPELAKGSVKGGDWRALVVLLVVTLPWWGAVWAPWCPLDDFEFIIDNKYVQAGLTGESIKAAWTTSIGGLWAPMTALSLMFDVSFFGKGAGGGVAGMHFTNVVLHVVNTWLVFLFLRRATGAWWRSLLVAGLFGMHPLRVESVAWVFERKDVLSGLFGLLALLAWERYVCAVRGPSRLLEGFAEHAQRGPSPAGHGTRGWFCGSVGFLVLSLMSKPMLVTFPVLLLLLDVWPFGRVGLRWKKLMIEKAPFLVAAVLSSAVTVWVQRSEKIAATFDALPLGTRLGTAVVGYMMYLRDTVWPMELAIYYPGLGKIDGATILLGVTVMVVVTGVVVMYWRKRQERGGAEGDAAVVGWAWFVVALLPVIGIIQSGAQTRADRYTYWPSIGLMMGVVFGVPAVGVGARKVLVGVGAACVIVLAVGTWMRVRLWNNPEAMLRDSIKVTGENGILKGLLGKIEQDRGNLREAEGLYRASISEMKGLHKSEYNLGTVLIKRAQQLEPELGFPAVVGMYTEALEHFQAAVDREPGNGAFVKSRDWTIGELEKRGVKVTATSGPG